MVIWHLVLRPVALADHAGLAESALALAYPVGDLVLVVGVGAVALRRPTSGSRLALGWLGLGVLVAAAADLGYGWMTVQEAGYQSGSWPDILWLLSFFCLAIGAHVQHARARAAGPSTADQPGARFSPLPYLSVALGYGLLLAVSSDRWGEPLGGLILMAVALTGLVVARQVAAVRENARLHAERAARASEARFRSLVQHAGDVILVVAADGVVTYHTPSMERVFGHPPEAVLGARLVAFLHPDEAPHALASLDRVAAEPGTGAAVAWRLRHRDGGWRAVEALATNLLADPTVGGVVLTIRDVTERRALEEQLARQAFHDPLTGLANRALFHERVGHALRRAERQAARHAVLFLDLDDFKAVNDRLGHAAGDAVLRQVAGRLLACVRAGDTVGRLGGDEFGVLLEDVADAALAEEVAERILAAMRPPLAVEGAEVTARLTGGIALGAGRAETTDDLLRNADIALYQAKRDGKGRFARFEPAMYERVRERLALEADLRAAVERGEFEVHYQPTVDLARGGVTGMEALVRWRHPERGLLAPGQFVPLAEETGLIVPIGRWVLREACRQACRWQRDYPTSPPRSVNVNVSARQLQHPELLAEVRAALAESGLAPACLTLEITESVLMEDAAAATAMLEALRGLGVRLAIDDFGTGYSSLSYLHHFPVDVLKIDKSFVDHLAGTGEEAALARAIVELGRTLNASKLILRHHAGQDSAS